MPKYGILKSMKLDIHLNIYGKRYPCDEQILKLFFLLYHAKTIYYTQVCTFYNIFIDILTDTEQRKFFIPMCNL